LSGGSEEELFTVNAGEVPHGPAGLEVLRAPASGHHPGLEAGAAAGPRGPLRGPVTIGMWPQSRQLTVSRETGALMEAGCVLAGVVGVREWAVPEGSRLLPFVTRIAIPGSNPDDCLTADITTWVGEDGEPLAEGGEPAVRNGEPVTGTFRYFLSFA